MRRLRTMLALLASLLLLACRPTPLSPAPSTAPQAAPVLSGRLVLPDDYTAQANAGQVKASATVTLLDPATFQAKGTGLTATDGTFTVQALATFTPTLGGLYLLESTKTLGTSASALFRLRTLVQFSATGWTSITGTAIQVSAETTAVSILWYQHGLAASDVIGKVSYDAPTRTHRFSNLTTTLTEPKLREVDLLVHEALRLDLDPIQLVRPGPDGQYTLALADKSRNRFYNAGFEAGDTTAEGWDLNAAPTVATYSIETGTPYEGKRAVRITVSTAGDTWLGQGFNGTSTSLPIKLASGSVYTVSLYARGAAGGEKVALALNYQTPFMEPMGPVFTLTTSWQRYAWTFVADHSTDRAVILVRYGSLIGEATYPRTLYFDAMQFEVGGASTVFAPQGNLLVDGFANALTSLNVTPTAGRTGRAVMVDGGLNMLPNSSFEQDSDGNGLPDGMITIAGPTGAYSLDPSNALFHARALRISKPVGTGDYAGFQHFANFQAGKTYTFSVWVKGENVSGTPNAGECGLGVEPYVGPGVANYTDWRYVAAPTGTFDWTRLSITLTCSTTCTSVITEPLFRNKSGTVWFDGFQIEENDAPSPYAGDGPDRLTFDASKVINRYQGTIAYWYRPTYAWEDSRGDGPLLVMDHPSRLVVFNFNKGRGPDGRLALQYSVRRETATDHDWMGFAYQPASPAWNAGEWHHLAMTWGPGGTALYLDGAQVGSHPYGGPIWTDSLAVTGMPHLGQLYFAGSGNNFGTQCHGALDGLRIWDHQQSAESIRRLYLGLGS